MPQPHNCRALIMAGGRSERMRATVGPLHKALVPVLGIPLIERNLRTLFDQGFSDVVVAINRAEPRIAEYVNGLGSHIEILQEDVPLGTIGAAREAIGESESLLVINVD